MSTSMSCTLRKLLTVAAAAGLLSAGCLVLRADAQRPGGPGAGRGQGRGQGFGRGGGRQMSVASMPVSTLDAIVKLTPAQKAKVTQIHDATMKQFAGFRPQPGQRPDPAAMQKFRDANTKASAEIEAMLTPGQKAKLAAARTEMPLYRLAGIPMGLYGHITLSAAQKAKLQQIQQGMRPGGPGGDRQAMMAAFQNARTQAAAILTPAQKAEIEKYRAAHPNERGGFGGPGGRGPGGRGRGGA